VKKTILISVVVPAYNEEKSIGQCLTALKNQDFPQKDYEIIVVDNNSTDKTAQIAKEMGAKVFSERTQGYVFALRKGCSQAKGGIIAITDADALVPKDWLKKIYQAFQKDPQVVYLGGKVAFQPKTILAVMAEPIWNFSGWFLRLGTGFNLVIKKDVYKKIGGFREEINFDTDVDLCLRARKEGRMVFLWNNPVVSSSRHLQGLGGTIYCIKGTINIICLILFKKTPFFQFGDVRE
jgi:glycosyltransferase involved in cell wall biosynthesis